jgi:hypothetical protein
MHVDLAPGLPGSDWGSVQGAYNLYEVQADAAASKATAGFVCVVGSHRLYDSLWAARSREDSFQCPKKHWHKLETDSPLQREASLVTSPANSLVLWRSDLLHKNYGGDFSAVELGTPEQPRLPRLTQFITWSPKKYRTEEALQRKALAVLDGCCNNHWAALSLRVPIIPFPAWSAGAKQIPVIRPFSSACASSTPDSDASDHHIAVGSNREEDGQKKEKTTGDNGDDNRNSKVEEEKQPQMKKRKCKKNTPLENLPQYIRELI